jgi:protein tyrosine phosphatase (PTP) superfamily phosphohydrolase (DUF442 family)
MSALLDAIAGVPNAAQPFPHLITGGQPNEDHISALKAAGVDIILDIRDPLEERPLDEPFVVGRAGIEYLVLPVTPDNLDDATLERVLAVVRANQNRRMFFHCASGNRVGAALLPYLMNDHGMSEPAAIEAARRMGMRSGEAMEWGLDYALRNSR